jgi:hypothetical protein
MRRLFSTIAVLSVLVFPSLGREHMTFRPTHPTSGFKCWTEVNVLLPEGVERICQQVSP